MSGFSVVGVAFAIVIVVVALCATARPEAASGLTGALRALADVFAAAWPWPRRTHDPAPDSAPAPPFVEAPVGPGPRDDLQSSPGDAA